MPKKVRRSFHACWTCRRRRVACDGVAPACSTCRKVSRRCEGYSVRLVWVDSEKGMYVSHSRRSLDPLSTWSGQQPYSTSQLEHLIGTGCEEECCQCLLHQETSNPFRIFRQADNSQETDTVDSSGNASDVTSNADSLPTTPISQSLCSNRTWIEDMLLHHYMNHVAFLMMPVDTKSNPWRHVYPYIAIQDRSLGSKGLFDALLSQSAFHLSVLHANTRHDLAQRYKLQAIMRYSSAIRSLRTSLDQQVDDFSACAATLFTLAQIEGCYAPEHDEWRKHLLGMYGLLSFFSQDSPWKMSFDAWVLSQNLALSLEIARTGSGGSFDCFRNTDHLLESISRKSHFGYTIGASSAVLQSIFKVHRLVEALGSGESLIEVEVQCGKILGELGTTKSDWIITQPSHSRQDYLNSLHQRIFRNAAVIYLHRAIYDVAPIAVRDHVLNVLCDTISFLDLQGGSVSLWPVFIAAVEACSRKERDLARQWLDYSCKLGISNRHAARCVIEEVWKQRDQEALLRDIEPEYVVLDWRRVQYHLKIDILLL